MIRVYKILDLRNSQLGNILVYCLLIFELFIYFYFFHVLDILRHLCSRFLRFYCIIHFHINYLCHDGSSDYNFNTFAFFLQKQVFLKWILGQSYSKFLTFCITNTLLLCWQQLKNSTLNICFSYSLFASAQNTVIVMIENMYLSSWFSTLRCLCYSLRC